MPEESNVEGAAGGSKKMLWIVGGIVIVVLLVAVFGGAGRRAMMGAVPGVDVDRNMDGTVTYSNNEGTVTVGGGASMPSNWPSDAPPAYSGATIMYSGTSNPQTGEVGSVVMYTTTASSKSVYEYYDSGLKAEGWTIDSTASMAAGTNVIVAKKDTRTFAIYIVDAGNGTVSVTAGIEL